MRHDAAAQLREQGVVLLRDVFQKETLNALKAAADRCFAAIETGTPLPAEYRFNPFSNSLLLAALLDFGFGRAEQLTAPLSAPGLAPLLSEALGCEWSCQLEQSWVRKKFAPSETPGPRYHPQDWHQDGALGVRFPLESGPVIPMTRLATCWIPLDPCGDESPGLEFVRVRQESLLHFTELADATLRQRFAAPEFWAPALEFGDGLVFLNGTLHRTHTHPGMHKNRISVEYRIFPR